MIGRREAADWASRLGVAEEQVRRDHLISHILDWLSSSAIADGVTFIGGTALARTHLDGLRMSEDVDVLVDDTSRVAAALQDGLIAGIRREYPELAVEPSARGPRGPQLTVQAPDVLGVRGQILRAEPAELRIPVSPTAVAMRYARLPSHVQLRVPTPAGFVAMKVAAYRDRAEPRDLFDLAELARRGHITAQAIAMTRHLTGARPAASEFSRVPTRVTETWHSRLAHQLTAPGTADEAVRTVANALGDIPSQ